MVGGFLLSWYAPLSLSLSHACTFLVILSFILPASCACLTPSPSRLLFVFSAWLIHSFMLHFVNLCVMLANLDPVCFPFTTCICPQKIGLFECGMIQRPGMAVTDPACLTPYWTDDAVFILFFFKNTQFACKCRCFNADECRPACTL